MMKLIRGGAVGAVAMLALSGCGALVEKAIEEAAEEATGVEVEREDGSISFEGEDVSLLVETDDDGTGSLTIDAPDGSFQVDADPKAGTVDFATEGFAGEEDQEFSFVADAEIPHGFPVPYPGGAAVESGSEFESGDNRLMHVGLRYPSSSFGMLVAYYDAHFSGDDGLARHEITSDGERTVGYVTNPDGRLTAVTVIDQGSSVVLFIETTIQSAG